MLFTHSTLISYCNNWLQIHQNTSIKYLSPLQKETQSKTPTKTSKTNTFCNHPLHIFLNAYTLLNSTAKLPNWYQGFPKIHADSSLQFNLFLYFPSFVPNEHDYFRLCTPEPQIFPSSLSYSL